MGGGEGELVVVGDGEGELVGGGEGELVVVGDGEGELLGGGEGELVGKVGLGRGSGQVGRVS